MSDVLNLSKQLMAIKSPSPHDNGCMDVFAPRLETLGFCIEYINSGDTTNLWAQLGSAKPLICFVGHTDVVPTGPLEKWQSDPFIPTEKNGYLYGRGAADMKTGVAAMVVAVENFVKKTPDFTGSIALLITSAEEDFSATGTPIVVAKLIERGQKIDYCIVGEPSSQKQFGDTVKNGRRGSLNGKLIIKGKQGHIAYPQNADNPIHKAFAALEELITTRWDNGNDDFQPTSFQISNIHSGTGADNVIPGELSVVFNFRFSPEVTPEQLQQRVKKILDHHQLNYSIDWSLSGMPFHCTDKNFLHLVQTVVKEVTGITPHASTIGGTSDGRFIAPTGAQVIEFGLINETIHQINECVAIADLEKLVLIYEKILTALLK